MTITEHAYRRYKRRLGRRTASKKRIITQINRDLARDVLYRKPSKIKNHYILVTSKYQAVCCRSRVVTIMSLNEDASNYKHNDHFDEELNLVA